ncbi:helix-turn-helix domain-containing protein [Streptococcus suis]|uniref:helix-turn-helix domain-containing protein n=1 Tax=Streptococcus suis TaxID=1307 RepID=UPI001556EFD3|nr:helix-turn-helix transcriptional regulator [Streptococcus suis]NQN71904.1 helix-turn-helix transcriptional regulator [Streptococcus suis]NQN74031.1 helix-turn-helix transcriptional regulator [Streptococcus suis]NQN79462.1 helix-turn-helix transcriptional regulator [Streptococcus suis]NQN83536.1 helix-turn-helix transcriptional regulator [Streptococcus suis]
MSTIENRLKALRNKNGLTQDELVSELNSRLNPDEKAISKMTVSNWENNKHAIKPDKAQKLADYFGVSVGYLLGYSDDNPMTFSSGEEFEKAREELLKKLQNSDTAELKLSYQGNELTGIEEKFTSSSKIEKDFLHNFSKLEEKDKSLIRYLTEKLVKDNE